jgi:hypothetical protein
LNDGQIQNPSNAFGIVPLSNFVPRGFGFVHHSIAILYHQVTNPNITIRNFFIAVRLVMRRFATLRGSVSFGANDRYQLRPQIKQTRRASLVATEGGGKTGDDVRGQELTTA